MTLFPEGDSRQRPVTVDSHQHFWQLGQFSYDWLTPKLEPIYRDFLPADLFPLLQAEGIHRTVLVQADASFEETGWLLSLADREARIAGVVCWVDMLDPHLEAMLDSFLPHARFKGVRPGIPAGAVDSAVVDANFRVLAKHGLSCDFLVNENTLPAVLALAKQHRDVWFVLDHLAGVRITPGGNHAWSPGLKPFADLPNVVMKLSGYLSAADPQPLVLGILHPYVDTALELFGADRLMFGSDWPVCTLGGPYGQAVELLRSATMSLSQGEKDAVWGGTATRVYRLLP